MHKTGAHNQFKSYKLLFASTISFLLGCMIAINLVPINKTCRIEDTDREHNIMKNSKLENPNLIILIFSAPQNLEKRTAIRETWLKLENLRFNKGDFITRHYFVIGSAGLTADTILHLSSEQSQFHDMLILPMQDSYANLTRKLLHSFEWLYEQIDVGLDFNYVLKCDDDTFVRLDSFIHELQHIEIMYLKSENILNDNDSQFLRVNLQANSLKPQPNRLSLYWGYFHGNAKIKTSGKWKENSWILCDNYLPYALGGGYVLSKSLVLFIGKNSHNLRHFNSEDVSVGTWLSSFNNIVRIHDRRFDTEWTSRGCENHHIISHHIAKKDMYFMYSTVLKTGKLCKKEITKRTHYMYDWGVPPSKCCNT